MARKNFDLNFILVFTYLELMFSLCTTVRNTVKTNSGSKLFQKNK